MDEPDAAVFFGRDAQIIQSLDTLRAMTRSGDSALLVIVGPSGAGKSSFMRAGLLPRLKRDDRNFLVLDIVRPARNALTGDQGLAQAVYGLRCRFDLSAPTLADIKRSWLRGETGQLRFWLDEVRGVATNRIAVRAREAVSPTLVLPLDQSEELFTLDAGEEGTQLLKLLGDLCGDEHASQNLIIVSTIRADRYEALQTAPEMAEVSSVIFNALKPMPVAQFKEVITGPAARSNAAGRRIEIEPALIDQLLADCGGGADTLPLLSLTLSRLYRDYGVSGKLTAAAYEAMGGLNRVVRSEIDSVLSREPSVQEGQLNALNSAFIPWLATIDPINDQPMRRVARLSDLPDESRPLIDAFVRQRLLTTNDRNGETIVEVALESLLRQWDELAGWLEKEREDIKEAGNLERAATSWENSQRKEAWLLEGERLTGAESLASKERFRSRLSTTRQFLIESRRQEDERIAAEGRQHQAELQAARDKQTAAEELAAVESRARATAQDYAVTLRKRARILRVVVAIAVVVAIVAVVGFVQAATAQRNAEARARDKECRGKSARRDLAETDF